jgi:hypothetical protein
MSDRAALEEAIVRLRHEAVDEVRPVLARLQSAVQALRVYTELLEQEKLAAGRSTDV